MISYQKLAGIVLSGFVVGLLGGAIVFQPATRATQIATFFEEICLPNHDRVLTQSPTTWGFKAVMGPNGDTLWIDPEAITYLKLKPGRCSLETLAPHALTEAQALELLSRVESIVSQRFPDLPHDPNAKMGTVFKGWAEGPVSHPSRWGVFLFAYPDWGDSAGSILSISAPKGEPI